MSSITFEEWQSLFLIYAIASNTVKAILVDNFTVEHIRPHSELSLHLTKLRQALNNTNLQPYLKYLHPIDHKTDFLLNLQ